MLFMRNVKLLPLRELMELDGKELTEEQISLLSYNKNVKKIRYYNTFLKEYCMIEMSNGYTISVKVIRAI